VIVKGKKRWQRGMHDGKWERAIEKEIEQW